MSAPYTFRTKPERLSPRRFLAFIAVLAIPYFFTACSNTEAVYKYKDAAKAAKLVIPETPLFDFGLRLVDSVNEKTFTVLNEGQTTATDITGQFTISAFRFKDGAYPGTGGTCGNSIEVGTSCTVVMEFAPSYPGFFTEYIHLTYFNGTSYESTSGPTINGRGTTGTSGTIDITLGTNGTISPNLGPGYPQLRAVTTASAGTFYAAGGFSVAANADFILARFTASGALDTNFGAEGIVYLDFFGRDDFAEAMVAQNDGKLILAGWATDLSTSKFALARYTPTGSLDSSFGIGGKVTTAFTGALAKAQAVVMQPNGRIVVAGTVVNAGQKDVALARYLSNGALDTDFGTGGTITLGNPSLDDESAAVSLQPDGKLIVAGTRFDGSRHQGFVFRAFENGTVDTSFAGGGTIISLSSNSEDIIHALVRQSDGKIIVAGSSKEPAQSSRFLFARLSSEGVIDTSFGNLSGYFVYDISSGAEEIHTLRLNSDGNVIAAGTATLGAEKDYAILRLTGDGLLDPFFGTGGISLTSFAGGQDTAYAASINENGKIIVVGESQVGSDIYSAIARFWP